MTAQRWRNRQGSFVQNWSRAPESLGRRADRRRLGRVVRLVDRPEVAGEDLIFLGRGTPRSLKLLPDATVFSARAMSKIRDGGRGVTYAAGQLVQHGADPLEGGEGSFGLYGSGIRSRTKRYADFKRASRFTAFVDRWHATLFPTGEQRA